MFRLVYSILFTLCMPFVFLKLLWRGFKAPEYKDRKLERFGFFKTPKLNRAIWVHAVSVGEVLAAEPIVRALLKKYPERDIVITTMTPTSSERIRKLFGDEVFHVYAPYDVPFMVKAFLRRIKPEFLIIMETELWPNMIHQARARKCPVILANARLSERSAKGYRRLNPVIGWMLNELSLVLCQYKNDAQRFASLGISSDKIHVTGSVKYDITMPEDIDEQARLLRSKISDDQPIWIAASTHEGEDEKVLNVHRTIKRVFPNAVLLLVPRHPERFDSAYKLAKQEHFKTYRRTLEETIPADSDVFVVDTMGELMHFYAASDVAFIGGSLVEVGGHNPIEPSALGIPVIIGPHIFNFEAICEQLKESQGLRLVNNIDELSGSLNELLENPDQAKKMGLCAQKEVEAGKGAVERVVGHITPLLT